MLKKVNRVIRYYDKGVKFTQEAVDCFVKLSIEKMCEVYKVNYIEGTLIDDENHKLFIEKYTIELAKEQFALLIRRSDLYRKIVNYKYSDDKLLKKTRAKMWKLIKDLEYEVHLQCGYGIVNCFRCGRNYDSTNKDEIKRVKADFGDGTIAAGFDEDTLVDICPNCTKIHNELDSFNFD